MTKNIISKILTGTFIAIIVLFFIFGIIGITKQNKEEKEAMARYEQMITEGAKTPLTNEIMEEDHDNYLAKAAESTKTFYMVAAMFVAAVAVFVLMVVFTVIVRGMEDGPNSRGFLITLVTFFSMIFLIVSFFVIAIKMIIPNLNGVQPEQEAYYFEKIQLVDSWKEEKIVETGSGDNRDTRTEITYHLYDENGKDIHTNKVLFERYKEPGLYYAGTTSGGAIFSLYPAKYFEPDGSVTVLE